MSVAALRELRYGLQYASLEESDTSKASNTCLKVSQVRGEAYLSYLLAGANYLCGGRITDARKEKFIGDEIVTKAGEYVKDIQFSSRGIGRGLYRTKQGRLVSAQQSRQYPAPKVRRTRYRACRGGLSNIFPALSEYL